jgi:copper/silver efflux system protein
MLPAAVRHPCACRDAEPVTSTPVPQTGGVEGRSPCMIHWLIDAALRNRFLIIAGFLLVAGWGYWALRTVPIDAIPDLSDNQVIVFTDWPGRSPQEVEDQITYPLTVSLQGLPGVRVVRSSSAFGFSMINVIFEDAVDIYFARTRVLERLNLVGKSLPSDVVPTLGPDATGVGHVFWYTVEGKGHSLRDLRSLQDWFIRYQLNAVPGVAEVASVGGVIRQYQIDVDPNRLRAFHPGHALPGHQCQYHVPGGDRHRHRGAGGCRHRGHRERLSFSGAASC